MKKFFYLLIFGLFISSCGYHSDEEFRAMQKEKDAYINYLQDSNYRTLDFYQKLSEMYKHELNILNQQLMKCH